MAILGILPRVAPSAPLPPGLLIMVWHMSEAAFRSPGSQAGKGIYVVFKQD